MDVNKILNADILDIIFEGRNKEYGAYELRKTYAKRFGIALLGMLLVCVLFFFGSFVANSVNNKKEVKMEVQDISLENMKAEEKKNEPPPPPPPPPPKTPPPKVEMKQYTPPKIVKDEEVKQPPPPVSVLQETKIGTINQEGVKDAGVIAAAPVVAPSSNVVAAPKQEEDYDKVFTVVQVPASFPGGFAAWQKYLERSLNSDLPAQNGAPTGNYTVVVTFIVDKQGVISDVSAENDPGYGTKEEAIRVIKRGPNWVPAIQNGRNVIARHRQQITFKVVDSE